MEISHKNYCYQNIKNNCYYTQVKIYFSERNSINFIQITNCATFELWSPIIWGVNLKDIFLLQKKAIRLVTHNSYTSHTEPIFKEKGLLNLPDMFLLNKLKFLHKLFHNNLPSYFSTYWDHFTKSVVNYNLRSRMLPVPRIYHVYAESLFVYQLVTCNDFESFIIIKLRERSHYFAGFSNYITRYLIDKYSDKKMCDVPACFACK